MTANQRFIIFGCFFLSGAAGLIAEIVWMKMFGLVFGSTAWAVAVVLATFMAGLALGSLSVRMITRGNMDLLKLYSIIEIGIGLSVALTPILLRTGEATYVLAAGSLGLNGLAIWLIQSLIAAGVMIIPTALMGATLPVLTWFLWRKDLGRCCAVGLLYGFNTLGAAAGAFFSAFYLIGYLGVSNTLYLAAGLNFISAVGILLLRLFCNTEESGAQRHRPIVENDSLLYEKSPASVLILAAVFITGAVSLAYEVIWTRLLTSLCLGSSVSAFASMLTVLLLGIMFGSMIYSAVISGLPAGKASAIFCLLAVLLAFTACLGPRLVVLAEDMAIVQWAWSGVSDTVPRNNQIITFGLFAVSALVLLCPAVIMGITFPLLAGLYSRDGNKGEGVGLFYAVNTIGGIAGTFIGTFVLLGKFGVCAGLHFLSGACMLTGVLVWLWESGRVFPMWLPRLSVGIGAICIVFLICTFLVPRDFLIRHNGGMAESTSQPGIVFDCEDADAWVSVRRSHDMEGRPNLNMFVNGRALSNTGSSARRYMKLMSHLPMLLHGNCRDSLVICFGTGMTFGSTTFHNLDSSECVEISRGVLKAADCFRDFNADVSRQVRLDAWTGRTWYGKSNAGAHLTVRLEDGRTHLLTANRTYDLITLEPPHPRDSGSVNLYSSEFYRLCRRRMRKGGMVMQWIPLFQQSQEEIRREIKTFLDEFPCVSGWMPSNLNLLLLGSDVMPKLDVGKIRVMMESEDIREDLADIGINNVRQLLDTFTATREALVEYAGNVPPLTDDVPVVEYYRRFGMDSLTMEQGAAMLRECSAEENFPELRQEVAVINLR